jgi:hypothetical protein
MVLKLAAQTFFRRKLTIICNLTRFYASSKVDFKIENVYDAANNITRIFIDIWTMVVSHQMTP